MEDYLNQEIIPAEPVSYDALLAKWLRFLFPVQIAAVVLLILSGFQFLPTLIALLSHGLSVCVIIALFRMAPANKHYRTSAILRCVVLGGGLLTLFGIGSLFALAVSICSIISAYQEYKGHSEVIAEKDSKLSHKWSSLFVWQLVVGLFAGFFSSAGAVIGVLVGVDTGALISVILIVTALAGACVQLFYLKYLKKMQAYYPAEQ